MKSLKLMAVGDISLGDFPFCAGFGIRSAISQGLSPFDNIASTFSEADIVFGNLETVISDYDLNINDISSWNMRGSPDSALLLKNAGFNVINIANNHTMQHGKTAFLETVDILNKHAIEAVGLCSKDKAEYASKPVIINSNGYAVGFLGYAFEEDVYGNAETGYAFGPLCNIQEDIKKLKNEADILIVSCHWGLEFITKPSPNTVFLGRNMIKWGADIVLGHHPHVLQGFEYYQDGIIVYSMGNFLFDMLWDNNFTQTAIFFFNINPDNDIQIKLIPSVIKNNYNIEMMNYKLEQKVKSLCDEINMSVQGDLERKTLAYYLEYEKLRKRNRYKTYKYFLENIFRIDSKLLPQIFFKTFSRWLNF